MSSAAPRPELSPATLQRLPDTLPPAIQQAAALLTAGARTARQAGAELLADALLAPLAGVAFLLGHKNALADTDDLNTMADALAELVVRRWPAFTFDEIAAALRRGASGEWQRENELLLCSLPCFTRWLSCYQAQVRALALEALQKAAAAPVEADRQLAPADLSADYAERVTEWAATLANGRPLAWTHLDPGGLIYDWLKRIGAFYPYLTQARYQRMRLRVIWQLCTDRPTDLEAHRRRKAFLRAYRRGNLDQQQTARLTHACRQFLLREWLHCQAATKGPAELLPWLEELAETAPRP